MDRRSLFRGLFGCAAGAVAAKVLPKEVEEPGWLGLMAPAEPQNFTGIEPRYSQVEYGLRSQWPTMSVGCDANISDWKFRVEEV